MSHRAASRVEVLGDVFSQLARLSICEGVCKGLDDAGLTLSQFEALRFVERHPQLTVSDVASGLKMSNPSATSVLSKLHQKRLVMKRGVRADKRLVRIVATPKGIEVIDRISSLRARRMEQLLAHLSPGDRERLLDSLNALIGSAAKSGALGRHTVCLCPGDEHLPGCPVSQNDSQAE